MYTLHTNPILVTFGALSIRWYSLAYIFGIILAWLVIKSLNRRSEVFDSQKISDDFFTFEVLSIIIGGRLGYVLFYNFSFYVHHFLSIFRIWEGGMSFHGGLVGVLFGSYLLCKKHSIKYLSFVDLLAVACPIGLFLGRIANFINQELYGRVTDSKFGIIFSAVDKLPRHPSQLYEATLEGLVLFITLISLAYCTNIRNYNGCLAGVFLFFYGVFRFIVEFFREPDAQIGYIFKYFTLGQMLTIPIVLLGVALITWSLRRKTEDTI